MFDTEAFIREVMKRPALYSSRSRESGDSKTAHWEEIARVIYKEWPNLHRPEQRMERIRELRKKWKSVRDNFLRDMKSPGSRKKRYVYHDLMTFLIPHLDPRSVELDTEIAMYLSTPVASNIRSNPLELWQDMKTVCQSAKEYLGGVGTSVPAERMFSNAGATIT